MLEHTILPQGKKVAQSVEQVNIFLKALKQVIMIMLMIVNLALEDFITPNKEKQHVNRAQKVKQVWEIQKIGAVKTGECDICAVGKHNQRVYNFESESFTIGDCRQTFAFTENVNLYCPINLDSRICLDKDGVSMQCRNGVWEKVTFSDQSYPRSCILCGVGSYGDATGLDVCKQCGASSGTVVGSYQDEKGKSACKNVCDQSKPYQTVVDGAKCREPPGKACFGLKTCKVFQCAGGGVNFVQQCHNQRRTIGPSSLAGYDYTRFDCNVCNLGEFKEVSYETNRRVEDSSGSDGS